VVLEKGPKSCSALHLIRSIQLTATETPTTTPPQADIHGTVATLENGLPPL
jgi:hypothetical protein